MQAALPAPVKIDAFAYCPHHPDGIVERYALLCECRKPAPGMLERLIADHHIDRSASFLVGDRASDLEAAERAGIRAFLFGGGDLDRFVADILEAL
ncbi:HAD-IIIA family hydrolase [Sphingomonas sp. PAMC 26621]|uniref:HAD-IIIA family hydrolase n=1 Tax=Sphingomonas sp. PAMC 26621 TaxID=1112213 RepID=UPI000288A471|nr:HAD-IIIA family hydrolase [Sphingomonas sp. PAMC 26621]